MKDDVMQKHIDLYVNNFSRSLGKTGNEAIHMLFDIAHKNSIIDSVPTEIYLKPV
jgi:predicted solute-binding protein